MSDAFHNPEPLPLIHTRRYPTYQLYATAGNGKLTPEETMVFCILETLSWLRKRFREFDLPKELVRPEPTAFRDFSLSDFSSFLVDRGYKLEVIVLQEEKAWSLQLIEPDSGSRPGDPDQDRPPVPGRMFETNIGYRMTEKGVECGFCTMVSEPSKTCEPCEVYRLAFIKNLARNEQIGLVHGFPLEDKPVQIYSGLKVTKLQHWLKSPERGMAAIILTEGIAPKSDVIDLSHPLTAGSLNLPTLEEIISTSPFHSDPVKLKLKEKCEEACCLLDAGRLARYKLGYVQFFTVSCDMFDELVSGLPEKIEPGDVILVEPIAFGGSSTRLTAQKICSDKKAAEEFIDAFAQDYPKNKPMTFGHVLFIPKAKEIESEKIIKLTQSKDELLLASIRKEEGIIARHTNEILLLNQKLDIANKKIQGLEEEAKETENWKASLQCELLQRDAKHNRELSGKDKEIQRLHALLNRPKTPKEVCGWVQCNYGDRMLFHAKAVDLMGAVGPGEVDLPILCDALEFLATDYRDELIGLIDEAEMNKRCSEKYNRPFVVTPLTGPSIEAYPVDYKIKYYIGHTGKPKESLLNLHLSIGNKSENLIRIYFLYDKEKQLIVVGSLPKHLPTLSYK